MTDPHCGYVYGLMRPGIILPAQTDLEDYFRPPVTSTQQMLWGFLTDDIRRLEAMAGEDSIYLTMGGDICQGNHGQSVLVSPRWADQITIAVDMLKEFCKLPTLKAIRMVKGTRFHVGAGGGAEVQVAGRLKHEKNIDVDVEAYYHALLTIRGVTFDISHHGPTTGMRKWLKGNQLRYYLRDIILDHLADGKEPPDCVLRGHYHERAIELVHEHTDQGTYKTWGAIIPAYSISNDDYTKKVTRSKGKMTVGMVVWEIIDGRIIEAHDWTRTIDIRRREIL